MARGSTVPADHHDITDSAHAQEGTAADRLFAELDNRTIPSAPDPWTAQVFGVHMVGAEAWVQVGSTSEPTCSVTLHLSPRATADHALAALQAWSDTSLAARDSVVHVMHIA